jgi:hypothetical protein
MFNNFIKIAAVAAALTSSTAVYAEQFVVELAEPMAGDAAALMKSMSVTEVERFDAAAKSYVVLDAKDKAALGAFFEAKDINPLKIKEVSFINSPEIGGGDKAADDPMLGYQSYIIERTVPGIGSLPMETQKQLSKGSNAAITQIGKGIEWVHSYLTDEGTYCVYRSVDTDKIIEHGKVSEFPIDTIAAVVHTKSVEE